MNSCNVLSGFMQNQLEFVKGYVTKFKFKQEKDESEDDENCIKKFQSKCIILNFRFNMFLSIYVYLMQIE